MMRSFVLILIMLIVAAGMVFGAMYFGIINPPSFMKDLSVFKDQTTEKNEAKTTKKKVTKLSVLEGQIDNLKKQVQTRDKTINQLKQANATLQEELRVAQEEANKPVTPPPTTPVVEGKTKYQIMGEYYANMKTAQAGAIMAELDDETVIGIFKTMKPDTASSILAKMDPRRAAVLTKKMLK